MRQQSKAQTQKWLSTTSDILSAQPEGLQKLLLQISKKDPDVSLYASDLAKLRMSGMEMENILTRIWHADTISCIDQIISRQSGTGHPCPGALIFLAELIKINLNIIHRTIH
jgi:hypothetical protein